MRPAVGLCDVCHEVLELNDAERCELCDAPGPSPCGRCRREPPPFAAVRAPYVYGGPLATMLWKAKFRRREDLAVGLGELLARDDAARDLATGAACVVPIPLGGQRRRQRGYNQSAIVARRLARHWQLPVRHALRRRRNTPPQSELDGAARRVNVSDAFAARGRGLHGTVVLVDDVVTSTETVRQASLALRHGGAERVVVLAVMRQPLE